jgi:MFS family permease
MDPFIRQFGEYNAKTKTYAIPAYFLSFMNSERGSGIQAATVGTGADYPCAGFVFIGFAIGIYIGSVISARYGRRMTVFCMSLWALCSATIIITATTKEQMLVSRILNYLYIVSASFATSGRFLTRARAWSSP